MAWEPILDPNSNIPGQARYGWLAVEMSTGKVAHFPEGNLAVLIEEHRRQERLRQHPTVRAAWDKYRAALKLCDRG